MNFDSTLNRLFKAPEFESKIQFSKWWTQKAVSFNFFIGIVITLSFLLLWFIEPRYVNYFMIGLAVVDAFVLNLILFIKYLSLRIYFNIWGYGPDASKTTSLWFIITVAFATLFNFLLTVFVLLD
jgi:hypothetical protein